MKLAILTTLFYLASLTASAPPSFDTYDVAVRDTSPLESYSALEKRKGGGGGKGGGSGSSSGKGGSSSSSSSGSSGGRPLSSYSFSSSSSSGGKTIGGSGTPRAYGNYYTGGAAVPYTAGARSPTRSVLPFALPIAGLAIFPGLWLYGSLYAYPYNSPYYWNENGRNQSSNVTCLCQRYQVCGCDPTDNSTFLNNLVGNGTNAPVNTSLVRTVNWGNGSTNTYINGSLANGTTAPGGTDPSNASEVSPAAKLMMNYGGYWVMAATVIIGIWLS